MHVEMRAIGSIEANCYIIDNRILIDPGDGKTEIDCFLADTGADIDTVVITHGHFDHMLGAAHIKKRYGAKIYISEADASSLWKKEIALCLPYAVTPFEPIRPDALLSEGPITLDGVPFEVMATPGHTPGSICLINRSEKTVFTGDTLFQYGYGRTDLYGGDEIQLFHSLERLLALPEDYYIYPGHGAGALIGEIKKYWR